MSIHQFLQSVAARNPHGLADFERAKATFCHLFVVEPEVYQDVINRLADLCHV